MITINKGTEPIEWTEKKATPGFSKYEPIPALRDALLIEQGYLCAYCLRRIPATDINEAVTSKIEHLRSREREPHLQLNYSNMAICCPGNLNDDAHCDKFKGGNSITFNLYNSLLQTSIRYSSNSGDISSTNSQWDTEINRLLNLNHGLLSQNRKETLAGVVEAISSKKWEPGILKKHLDQWSSKDSQGKLRPFCGIVIWYLQKKLRQDNMIR